MASKYLPSIVGLALVVLAASPAFAQLDGGVRAGVSVNPDQFYFGGHVETGPIADQIRFRPNIEVGLGDNLTLISINPEFVYRIPAGTAPWRLYAGGGPAINIYRFDRAGSDRTETEAGFNVLFGAEHSDGLFFEIKVGAFDSPELKFGVGYTWR
jgi:hypothetical protein